MSVDPEARCEVLFERALELPPADRLAFLNRSCDGDDDLREAVQMLLHLDEEDDGRLEELLGGLSGTPLPPGSRVGRYRIVSELGVGSFGIVYRADDVDSAEPVAVKVLRPDVGSSEALGRFRLEWRILERLEHPGIARVYEAGLAETVIGRLPYFAMEYVEGEPLTSDPRVQEMGIAARLALFVEVCRAVDHAHRMGIVHRDLKPGNILVDATGHPKILDFGVAQVADPGMNTTPMRTHTGDFKGTIVYMSPEQVMEQRDQIDRRSDVYSLGVVLFELLTGRLPYRFAGRGVYERLGAIVYDPPLRLGALDRTLRGELEWIVDRALGKKKEDRYPTAAALARDIERFLNDEAPEVRPPSTVHQLRTFASRNRALVMGIAGAFAALSLGLVGMTWQTVRATRAERMARQAAAQSAQIASVYPDIISSLTSSGSGSDPAATAVLRRLVDESVRSVESVFAARPLQEAAARELFGRTYLALGQLEAAEQQFSISLRLREDSPAAGPLDLASAYDNLAEVRSRQGQYAAAEHFLRQALGLREQALADEDPSVISTITRLADVQVEGGRLDGADADAVRAVALARRMPGDAGATLADALTVLARVRSRQERLGEAIAVQDEARAIYRKALGYDHWKVARALRELAGQCRLAGDRPRAVALLREAMSMLRRQYGQDNPEVVATRAMLEEVAGDSDPDSPDPEMPAPGDGPG